jgi:hypothetical protein
MADAAARRRRVMAVAAALVAIFLFRLLYGLSREFFLEDETQIFLMGLRYYATGAWPFFGADVVWTNSEIPGALQALLVGVPFKAVAMPEAPFVLLNILSMAALSAFAWYVTARLPQLPKWLVWIWLMTLPWTLEFSTHVINPSYLLPASLVFFIGFFEAMPVFRVGAIPEPAAFALMGAAIAWAFQIHMSWPLLLPYAVLVWSFAWRQGIRTVAANTAALMGGGLLIGSLFIPTLVVFGLHGGTGGTLRNMRPHWVSPYAALSMLARLFSFASFEIWRFLATDDPKRQTLLLRHLWIAPLAVVVWVAGLWQPVWMLREWFRTRSRFAEWPALKWLIAGTVGVIYTGYCFVLEPSQAHAFYIVAPMAFMYAAYCWTFIDSPRWRQIGAAILAINIVFHLGQAWIQAPQQSLYRNREVGAAAVRLKEPEMFAHRRPFAIQGGPAALDPTAKPYDVRRDIELSDVHVERGPRGAALWTLTLRNQNMGVAYRDIHYRTHYLDEQGHETYQQDDYIQDVFQPGASARVELIEGFVDGPWASTTIEVFAGDALLPLSGRTLE